MLRRLHWFFLIASAVLVLSAATARAENEGQDDLDQATEKKLAATTTDDLSQVIDLCESALKKGLDPANTQFAQNLLTSTLMQRAGFLSKVIVERAPVGWPQLRKAALEDLEKAIKTQPNLPAAQILIARLQMLPGGDRAEALKAAQKATELAKDDAAVQVEALVLQAKLVSDTAKMEELFDEALKIAPKNDELLVYRGRLRLEQGKPEEALVDLAAAVKTNPENAEAQVGRGQAFFALGRNDEAIEAFGEAIKLAPDSPSPYLDRARVHLSAKQYPETLSDIEDALKNDTTNAVAILLRAQVHQQQGDTKAAEEDVDELLKSTNEIQPALRVLLSSGSNGLRQTVNDLESLLQIEPKNTKLLSEIAMLYTLKKQPRKAIAKYSAALDEDPKNASALRGRADAYLSIGKHAEAIADYNKDLELKSDDAKDPGLLNNLAWVLATSPDESNRDGKRAVELATEAANLTKNKQAHILSTLAASYAETGDFDKAKEWSEKAVQIGSEDPETNEQLKKELASYGDKKPWREKQEIEDTDDTPKADDKSAAAKKQ